MSDLAIVALFCGGGGPLLVGEAGRQAGRQAEGEGAWGRGGELPPLRRNNMAGGGARGMSWVVGRSGRRDDGDHERHRQRQWPL